MTSVLDKYKVDVPEGTNEDWSIERCCVSGWNVSVATAIASDPPALSAPSSILHHNHAAIGNDRFNDGNKLSFHNRGDRSHDVF